MKECMSYWKKWIKKEFGELDYNSTNLFYLILDCEKWEKEMIRECRYDDNCNSIGDYREDLEEYFRFIVKHGMVKNLSLDHYNLFFQEQNRWFNHFIEKGLIETNKVVYHEVDGKVIVDKLND